MKNFLSRRGIDRAPPHSPFARFGFWAFAFFFAAAPALSASSAAVIRLIDFSEPELGGLVLAPSADEAGHEPIPATAGRRGPGPIIHLPGRHWRLDAHDAGSAELRLPETGKHFLIALAAPDDDGLRITVLPADIKDFPPGGMTIFNATGRALRTRLSEETFTVPPREHAVPPPGDDSRRSGSYPVEFAVPPADDGGELRTTSRWVATPGVRSIVFVDIENGRRLRYRVVEESPAWAEEEVP